MIEELKQLFKGHKFSFENNEIEKYSIYENIPSVTVWPRSIAELSQWLSAANSYRTKVNIWGAGQHQYLGNIPENPDIVIDLKNLNKIIELSSQYEFVKVESGIRLIDLQKVLRLENLDLAIDTPFATESTIGGILASNSFIQKNPTDHIIKVLVPGLTVTLSDGSVIKTGDTGSAWDFNSFDGCRLFIGSMGSIGVITEITLRVIPYPEISRIVMGSFDSFKQIENVVKIINELRLNISALVYLKDIHMKWALKSHQHSLMIRVDGFVKPASQTISKLTEIILDNQGTPEFPENSADQSSLSDMLDSQVNLAPKPEADGFFILKVRISVSHFDIFIRKIQQLQNENDIAYRIMAFIYSGLIYIFFETTDEQQCLHYIDYLRMTAQGLGGNLMVYHGPRSLKERINVWGFDDSKFEWMRKIKHSFDPNNTFITGRFSNEI